MLWRLYNIFRFKKFIILNISTSHAHERFSIRNTRYFFFSIVISYYTFMFY